MNGSKSTDHVGRASSEVRFGKLRLAASNVSLEQYHLLLNLALSDTQHVDGYVQYLRADGQGTFANVWFRHAYLCHFKELFNSRGTDGKTASLRLSFELAPAEMGREAGSPGEFVMPPPRAYTYRSQPPAAYTGLPLGLKEVLTPKPPLPPNVVEQLRAASQAKRLLDSSRLPGPPNPLLLTLTLVLLPANSGREPGNKAEWDFINRHHLPPADPAKLRLAQLEAQHAAGTLAAEEEAEYIALLAKVRGIHVSSLADLKVEGPLRGDQVALPGFHNINLAYIKRTDSAREALRRKFDSSARKHFLQKISSDPAMIPQLKKAGFDDKYIARMATGKLPSRAWQVHHKLPLDDGGDNSFSNLMLIKNDPYHQAITNLQNAATSDMQPGDTLHLQWPTYNGFVYPALKPTSN